MVEAEAGAGGQVSRQRIKDSSKAGEESVKAPGGQRFGANGRIPQRVWNRRQVYPKH
jgi:hypothetical protein